MDRLISRRRALAGMAGGALTAAGTMSCVGAHDTEKISLALDWYPNANHAGIFLAESRDYWHDADLELDAYTPADPTTVLQTVGAGRDQFGISYQTDVLLARDQGVPVVSVAAFVQQPLVTIMALQDAGITSPAALAGKTVGYPGIPSQAAFLATMLEGAGLTLDEVSLVNIGFNLLPALISTQVDAVLGGFWTHETILAEQEGYEVDVMRVEEWGVPSYYELVLVASEKLVEERPELVTAVLSVLQQGYRAAIDAPRDAIEALTAAYPELDEEVERQGIALLSEVWLPDTPPVFGYQDPEQWTAYAAWMVDRGLIGGGLDVTAAFRADLLPLEEATPTA
ncbi:MAG: ABC transporter substrate-binding protein [Thermomicrobiales bacterium]|nr:ABC transporter substrate-binding protein [Thermomicrobiales bacterium]